VKLVRIASGRHPYEVVLMIAAPAVGFILLLSSTQPPAVDSGMPGFVRAVWMALLIIAGAVGLTGVFWPGRIETSLSIEAVGVLVLGSAAAMYTVAVLAVAGFNGAAAGGFTAAVAAGSWWRLGQIWRDLHRLDRAVQSQVVADVPLLVEQRERHE
jgi:hypothetical protein